MPLRYWPKSQPFRPEAHASPFLAREDNKKVTGDPAGRTSFLRKGVFLMIRNTRHLTVVLSLVVVLLSLSLPVGAAPAAAEDAPAAATLSALWEWITSPVRSFFSSVENLDCRGTIDPDGHCQTGSSSSSVTSDCRGTIDPDGRCRF
jgi:hypothetical protein